MFRHKLRHCLHKRLLIFQKNIIVKPNRLDGKCCA